MTKLQKNKAPDVYKIIVNVILVILILLCVYSLLIDLTYAGYFDCNCMRRELVWLTGRLSSIGFSRSNALKLLQSGIGIAVTVFIFICNWGVDLFKHSERKVFGISWGELQSDELQRFGHKFKFFMMLMLPLIIICTIILELCVTSYALLFFGYFLICGKYWNFAMSYNKKAQREKVVDKLIGLIDGEKDCIDDNTTDFCSTVESIRAGILEKESWNAAWILFDAFLKAVMEFEKDKCFKLSGYFFEVVFDVPKEEYVQKELIFVKKYIAQIETDNDGENTVLWSLFCNVALQWKSETMTLFLSWFVDVPRRSRQRVLCKRESLEPIEIQRQSAVVLVMLEHWMRMHEEDIDIDYEYINKVYEYGKEFLQKDCGDIERFLDALDDLYKKKYRSDDCNAAKALYRDTKYQLNNTVIMTKLKYELWEKE